MSSRPSTPSRVWPPASRSRAPSTESMGRKSRSVSSLPTRSANTHWQTKMVLASTQAPTKSAFTRSSMRSTPKTRSSVTPSATPNLRDSEFKTYVPPSSKSRSVKARTSINTVPGRTKQWNPATRSGTRTGQTPASRNYGNGMVCAQEVKEEEKKSSCCCIFWILVAAALALLVILGLCGVFDSKPTESPTKKININDLKAAGSQYKPKVTKPVKVEPKPEVDMARLQPQRKPTTPTRRPVVPAVPARRPAPKKPAPRPYRPSRPYRPARTPSRPAGNVRKSLFSSFSSPIYIRDTDPAYMSWRH